MLARLRTGILAPLAPLALLAGLATAATTAPAAAQGTSPPSPVLVELYTSQGCSSCPPADSLLAELAGRDDVIALSLHVDYWDYLGWRDTFAQHQFTERQYAYRDALGNNVVYTPQVIVQGRRAVPAATAPVDAAIRELRQRPRLIEVSIRPEAGMLKCRIAPGPDPITGTVWIAKYRLSETVEISRGENAGKTITYRNVVNSLMRMGTWSGSEAEEVEMPHPDPGEGVAVWIQDGAAGRVIAAAKVENPVAE